MPSVVWKFVLALQPLPARGVRRVSVSRCDGHGHDACPGTQPRIGLAAILQLQDSILAPAESSRFKQPWAVSLTLVHKRAYSEAWDLSGMQGRLARISKSTEWILPMLLHPWKILLR